MTLLQHKSKRHAAVAQLFCNSRARRECALVPNAATDGDTRVRAGARVAPAALDGAPNLWRSTADRVSRILTNIHPAAFPDARARLRSVGGAEPG
ncbi:hypothetical protein [Burkholderia contaminans]|uniref:hypothetical protein n=1 Tax=Burkholderia contaminans TaxID=488447 RepID=UPI0015E2F029|nr:hypothetical protein [Burkholderia contaminans]